MKSRFYCIVLGATILSFGFASLMTTTVFAEEKGVEAETVKVEAVNEEIAEPVPEIVVNQAAEKIAKIAEETLTEASPKKEEKQEKNIAQKQEGKVEERVEKWYDYLKLQPFVVLRLRLNFKDLKRPDPMLYRAGIRLIADFDPFTLVFEPHFAAVKARPFHVSNVSVRQALVRWKTPVKGLSLAGGILYNQFGMFWDDSFFGNVLVYQGRKIDADYNLELAYNGQISPNFGVAGWLQLGMGNDTANVSITQPFKKKYQLTANDFESDPNFKEGLATRIRLMPRLIFGDFRIITGLSFEMQFVDRLEHVVNQKKIEASSGNVLAFGGDLTLGWRSYKLQGEFAAIFVPGSLSYRQNDVKRYYATASTTIPFYETKESDWFSYNALIAGYHLGLYTTENFQESIIRAGVTTKIYKYLTAQVEYVRWGLSENPRVLTHGIEMALKAEYF